MKRSDVKNLAINLISSTIFQLALIFISGSGIAYTLRKMIMSLHDSKINISVLTLIILILSFIMVTLSTAVLILKIHNHNKIKKDKKYFNDVDDYYFIDYEKHITIYKNGNGIIIHKFTVVVNNVEKFKKIRRKLNIEDGKKTSRFPAIEDMLKTKISERFDKFGFWYYAKNNIISEVKEYYWQKNSSGESKRAKSNPKEIRWIFKINKQHVEKEVPYEITYVISVPGLAPLEDGRLNRELLDDEFDETSSSNMNIDHKIRNLKYTISFENEIELETTPKCSYIVQGQDESEKTPVDGINKNNIIYNQWIFTINNPKFNSDINIVWKYNDINNI